MLSIWQEYSQMAGGIGQLLVAIAVFAMVLIIYKVYEFIYLGVIPINKTKDKSVEFFTKLRATKDQQIIDTHTEYYLNSLQQGLPILHIIVTISPLLGLLGTVIGMIESFQEMSALGDAVSVANLATGIWKALITTASGISVAVPVLVITHILQNLIDRHIITTNKKLNEVK